MLLMIVGYKRSDSFLIRSRNYRPHILNKHAAGNTPSMDIQNIGEIAVRIIDK